MAEGGKTQDSSLPYQTKFRRTKFSTRTRNFDTFVRFLSDFCIEILDKIFDGHNFRHQAKISTILSDEFLSDKVYRCRKKTWYFLMV